MGFKVSNGSININVNTFSNVGGNNKNTFKLDSYDDIGEIDYSQYAPVQQNVDFSIAADNLRFDRAQLADIYTWKDFALDLIAFRDQVDNFFAKTAATVANVTVSIVEGLVSFVEAVVDTAALLVGAVATVFTGLWDIGVGIFTGNWDWSATGTLWKEYFVPFIGYDATSAAFDWIYEETPMKDVNDTAFDWGKRGGTVYSVGKGIGYYTGVIIVTVATCGGGSAATIAGTTIGKTTVQAGVVAVGSMGKNSQKNFNAATKLAQQEGRELTGDEIWAAIGKSAGQAALDGGTIYLAGKAGSFVDGKVQSGAISPGVAKFINKDNATIAVKALKPTISEGVESIINQNEFDFEAVVVDTAAIVISEKVAGAVGSKLKKIMSNTSTSSGIEAASDLTGGGTEATKKTASIFANKIVQTLEQEFVKRVVKDSTKTGSEEGLSGLFALGG